MPETITLSAAAVMALRFEIKGWRSKVKGSQLSAYRELAAAGIMEPIAGSDSEYRFTEDGFARREEILDAAVAYLHSLEPRLPGRIDLSEAARSVLGRYLAGDEEVTDTNRPAFRELATAGIMISVGTFTKGDDCVFKLTRQGWERRFEFAGKDCMKESA
jgi:hypothetical protein